MSDDQPAVETIGGEDHEPEVDFEDHVETVLGDEHGEHNVERQVQFDDDRIADFVVDCGWYGMAFELENDSGAVAAGCGQAEWYAENVDNAIAVLCIPEGHIDDDERQHVLEKSDVLLREIPFEGDVSGV